VNDNGEIGSVATANIRRKTEPIDIMTPVTISGGVSLARLIALPMIADAEFAIRLAKPINRPMIDIPIKLRGKKYRSTPRIPIITRIVSLLVGSSPNNGIAESSTIMGVILSSSENVIAGR
jgi:hypothetical protein